MSGTNQNLIHIKSHNHEAKTLKHDCSLVTFVSSTLGTVWNWFIYFQDWKESEERDGIGKET